MHDFLLLCTPRGAHAPQPLLGATDEHPFLASLLEGRGGVRLVSPRSKEHWTVPMQTGRDHQGRPELRLPAGQSSHLEGPGADPNWLYFAQPQVPALLLGRRGYRSANLSECGFAGGNRSATDEESVSRRASWSFQRDVPPHLFVEQRGREGDYVRLTSEAFEGLPNAWLNPVLLHVQLDGDAFSELTSSASGTRVTDSHPSAILRRLFKSYEPSWLIPAFGASQDLRFRALSELLRRSARSSAVEFLLLGGGCRDLSGGSLRLERRLGAFLALDALRGGMSIGSHGAPGQPTRFGFHFLASNPAPNSVWFAEQVCRAWAAGVSLRELPKALCPQVAGKTEPALFRVGSTEEFEQLRRVQAPDALRLPSGVAEPRQVDTANTKNMTVLLQALSQGTPGLGDEILQYFSAVVSSLAECGLALPTHWLKTLIGRVDAQRSTVDVAALKLLLSRHLVLPESALLVEVPRHGGVEPCCIDLRTTAPQPERHWVFGWLQAARVRHRAGVSCSRLRVQKSDYWWNTWHDSLFLSPVDVELEFRAGGFVVGRSRVGRGRLGPSLAGAATWSRANLGLAAVGRDLRVADEAPPITPSASSTSFPA